MAEQYFRRYVYGKWPDWFRFADGFLYLLGCFVVSCFVRGKFVQADLLLFDDKKSISNGKS